MRTILLSLVLLYTPSLFAKTGPAEPPIPVTVVPAASPIPLVPVVSPVTLVPDEITQPKTEEVHISVDSIPGLMVDLKSQTNWYLILLPFVTITIVLASMLITLRTLRLNADSMRSAFKDTIQAQRDISEREIKTKLLAENRQKWINELRNDLAEFAASLHHLSTYVMISGKEPVTANLAEFVAKAELKQAKINLMINPAEPDHKELIQTISNAMQSVYEKDGDIHTPLRKLTEISQAILKREWERVKKLD